MMFYLFAFFIAFFQSSVISAFFPNALISPNILLVYLFLNLLKKEDLKKVLVSGLLLDLFQDYFGLNTSGFILFTLMLSFLRERFEFPNRFSLTISYIFLALLEKLWTFLLFRWKYYIQIDPLTLLISYSIEIGFLFLMTRFYVNKRHE